MKTIIGTLALMASVVVAQADVVLDVTYDQVKAASNSLDLGDLSVNDTAFLYNPFCFEDNKLFVPVTERPTDLAGSEYDASGIIYQVKVLPGHKLSIRIVDARQAQLIARGTVDAAPSLSQPDFNSKIVDGIEALFRDNFFSSPICAVARSKSPLIDLQLYTVESINGFNKLSDLLQSALPSR